MTKALVITSIAAPNPVLRKCAEGAKQHDFRFIVMGDVISPPDFYIDGCDFYQIEEQEKLPFKLAKILPKKHYGRKNLGYLLARNCDLIIETDDDNFPRDEFWAQRERMIEAEVLLNKGWFNVYESFSKERIWPRGFPLENIQEENAEKQKHIKFKRDPNKKTPSLCPIQQGLADENPDVDAVYRMTMKLPIDFDKEDSLALGAGTWCPFNSQNTTWFKEAFPLMYLPSYCSFRMTDIWRSFVAQRIAWTCGWNISFHNSTVWQERNAHNLLKDFADEVPGYLNNSKICKDLEALDLRNGTANLTENLMRCYKMLTANKYIGEAELPLVEAWINDISSS